MIDCFETTIQILNDNDEPYTLCQIPNAVVISLKTRCFEKLEVIIHFVTSSILMTLTEIPIIIPQEKLTTIYTYLATINENSKYGSLIYRPNYRKVCFVTRSYLPTDITAKELEDVLLHLVGYSESWFEANESDFIHVIYPDGISKDNPTYEMYLHQSSHLLNSKTDEIDQTDPFYQSEQIIKQIMTCVKAGTPVIHINSLDSQYVKFLLQIVSQRLNYELYGWNVHDQLTKPNKYLLNYDIPAGTLLSLYQKLFKNGYNSKEGKGILSALGNYPRIFDDDMHDSAVERGNFNYIEGVLSWFEMTYRQYFLLAMEDFNYGMSTLPKESLISFVCELSQKSFSTRTLIIITQYEDIPARLHRTVPEIDCMLPDRGMIRFLYLKSLISLDIHNPSELPEEAVTAVLGLTSNEIKGIFSRVLVEKEKITIEDIPTLSQNRRVLINQEPSLTYYNTVDDFQDLGGMDLLKKWVLERKDINTSESAKFGIRSMKGILLIGPPGTGKTLVARIIACMWKLPLIELKPGMLLGHYMGSSENNTHRVLMEIDSFSPCVLLIDELEKAFSHLHDDSNQSITNVLSMILKWLQDRTTPVFIVATVNEASVLPPELIRKGRFDEVFFVDLPSVTERKDILQIHFRKRGHLVFSDKILRQFAEMTIGFSGAELESIVENALIHAYNRDKVLRKEDVLDAIQATTPLASRKYSEIQEIRNISREIGISITSETTDADKLINPEFTSDLGTAYR